MLNLSDAVSALNKIADILESDNVPYWIDSGTLLGAYRDKNFNIYDHDIDIRMKESDMVSDGKASIVKSLWEGGFHKIEGNGAEVPQILFSEDVGGVLVDLKFCPENEDFLWYYVWREPDPTPMLHVFPKRFFEKLGVINLYGRDYPCPSPVEEYILHHYGPDWRKFKVRIEDANETDATWDYMKDPPCAMTQGQFFALQQTNPFNLYGGA